MLARVFTATMEGLNPVKIEVEVDGVSGTPNFILIGLAAKAVDEAKERVTAALQNCGIRIKAKRTIVNLAPADLQKTGTAFELAIAVGLLKMFGEISIDTDQTMFFGELSLDGVLKPVAGILPLVMAAKKMGYLNVVIPEANQAEVAILTGIKIFPIRHLSDYIQYAQKLRLLTPQHSTKFTLTDQSNPEVLLEDITGQFKAKRALQIAAAGGHNLHMIGPPGAGKTLLAKALCSILPPLTEEEAIETTSIHSIAGIATCTGLITTRPFRSPHHTVSTAGMIGGGSDMSPGEISLAHRGILFLDEFPEFARATIEALRQPLEDGYVHITRAKGTVEYPARFSLVAASNPCPCGYWHSKLKPCSCSPGKRKLYSQKISGPVIDRIDLHFWVQTQNIKLNQESTNCTLYSTSNIRNSVLAAHQLQQQRFANLPIFYNAEMSPAFIKQHCICDAQAEQTLYQAQRRFQLTTRSFFKVLKVARTIADLEGQEIIGDAHLSEALQYRPKEIVI